MARPGAGQRPTRRDDVQVGPYAYRVLRPARPPRGAVLTRDRRLRVARREGLRMLAIAELVGERTLVAFPLRDERGIPFDLVLADESLKFPAARWSDVRQRLGAGRAELHVRREPAGSPPSRRRADVKPDETRHALIIPVDAHRTDLARLRRGELDLGYLRIELG
ncbi:hypothetical protein GCM10022255_099640 [Dactylosporangium darangshiense]|uniref:Uncharacterized protein n=1 Tax=Dactylosporangium darangshiense TaxID=579108 RepID=A0ABP8DRI5_9ACTN